MMIGGRASITIPRTINTICTKRMNTIQFGAWAAICCATAWGNRSKVRTNENIDAIPSTTITTPVSEAVCNRIFGRSSVVSSRYTKNETIKPYTTATAEASVGVKMPP